MSSVPVLLDPLAERDPYDAVPDDVLARSAGELLDELADVGPGPEAALLLTQVAGLRLSRAERLRLVEAWERQTAWAQAGAVAAVAAFAGPADGGSPDGLRDERCREDVALACGESIDTAHRRIQVARAACHRFTTALGELRSGRLTYRHLVVLAEACAELTDAQARAVEARVIPVRQVNLSLFRRAVRRAVIQVAPQDADDRHRRARAGRRVQWWADRDGMANLLAHLPAADVLRIHDLLTAHARRMVRDDPTAQLTVDAARADVFVGLLTGLIGLDDLDRTGSDDGIRDGKRRDARTTRRGQVGLLIDLPTWLGLRDNPGVLPGYGPIPPQLARELADRLGVLRRMVFDPVTSTLLDYGRTTYQVPGWLDDFVHARDGECRFPGCVRPGSWCEDDHAVPWDEGGTTDPSNIHLLCKRHHQLKTERIWSVTLNRDGSADWAGPAGRSYRAPPPAITGT